MPTDECGHPLTGGAGAADRYDAAVRSLLFFRDDVADAWDATVADEPTFVMGQVGRAYLHCLSSETADAAAARRILDAVADVSVATDRERRHVDAARAYAAGDLHGASEQLARLSIDHPRDLLALMVGHQLDFFRGDAASLRDRPGRALLEWDAAHPLFGFVLGMHAFGLEECNLYDQAEGAARRSLDLQPRDVWALHAAVHVFEMQARIDEGLRFLDERRHDWAEGNFFVVHNSWHEALLLLDSGDAPGALAIYDERLHHDGSAGVALELLDATALLWRMHLDHHETGKRWHGLADAWSGQLTAEPWYVFNDAHACMAFACADRLDDARALVDILRRSAASPSTGVSNTAMTAEVGLPVCEAIVAFAEGRYQEAVEHLFPIRTTVHRFGGSNAQRDVVARTLVESALRAGDMALARALTSERLAVREASPYNQVLLTRLRSSATT